MTWPALFAALLSLSEGKSMFIIIYPEQSSSRFLAQAFLVVVGVGRPRISKPRMPFVPDSTGICLVSGGCSCAV